MGHRADRVLWLWFGFIVLRLDLASIAAVGFVIGGMFVAAAVDELMHASATNSGWKWLHYGFAVVFILGSLWAFGPPDRIGVRAGFRARLHPATHGHVRRRRAISTKAVDELW